jgi:hypothetical protein
MALKTQVINLAPIAPATIAKAASSSMARIATRFGPTRLSDCYETPCVQLLSDIRPKYRARFEPSGLSGVHRPEFPKSASPSAMHQKEKYVWFIGAK